jgi:hypothetical protein
VGVFHIELSHARETVWRYNLTEQELDATILVPWARGESVQLGEHLWRPDETTITVLDGPRLPLGLMTMGRGWMNAKREGREVTTEVLASFRERYAAAGGNSGLAAAGVASAPAQPSLAPVPNGSTLAASAGSRPAAAAAPAAPSQPTDAVLADAVGLELLRGLSDGPLSLRSAWRLCGESHRELEPGASLELAMKAVASLASSRLVTLELVEPRQGDEPAAGDLDARIRDVDAWATDSGPSALQIRRT